MSTNGIRADRSYRPKRRLMVVLGTDKVQHYRMGCQGEKAIITKLAKMAKNHA
jgi:hypothetical protein